MGAEGALASLGSLVDEQGDGHLRSVLVASVEIAHSTQHVFH
jgi:hypothetical protein